MNQTALATKLPPSSGEQRQLRKYEKVWLLLKKEKKVTLELRHKNLLPRVRKAVIKEKDMDLAFKMKNDIEKPRLHFSWDEKLGRLVIELKMTFGLMEIVE